MRVSEMSLPICPLKQKKPQRILISYGDSLESMNWLKPVTEVKNMYLGYFS